MALHRYRLEGTIAEIRLDELLFSPAEVGTLLDLHGLDISAKGVREVVDRAEGWAAGVRLAALALPDGGDHGSLDDLAGEYRLLRYSATSPAPTATSLRALSVLDQILPGLGAQVTGRFDADELLRQLWSRNLFVAPLRGRAGAYRIHPLLRTVLNRELGQRPAVLAEVQCRAADWFAAHGHPGEAIRHAAAGGDWARAARCVVGGHVMADLLLSTASGSVMTRQLHGMPDLDSADVHLVRAALAVGAGELESARASLARCPSDGVMSDDWQLSAALVRSWLSVTSSRPTETLLAAAAARARLTAEADRCGSRLPLLRALVLRAEGVARPALRRL